MLVLTEEDRRVHSKNRPEMSFARFTKRNGTRNVISQGFLSRFLSQNEKPTFDKDISEIYSRIARQHANPAGPWPKMLKSVAKEAERLVDTGLTDHSFQVLDLASGPGEPGLTIAKSFPSSRVTITDISEDQINIAAASAEGLGNINCMVVDSQDLSKFADNSIDIVTSCYGYMFCDDLDKAFSEALRVIKPGGCLIITYWLTLPMMKLSHSLMEGALGHTPPTPALNPLSLSTPGLVPLRLHKAGFVDITTSQSVYPFELGKDEDDAFAMTTLPVRSALLDLVKDGKVEAVEKGKKMFWKTFNDSSYTERTSDGMLVLNGNEFEMAVARKLL